MEQKMTVKRQNSGLVQALKCLLEDQELSDVTLVSSIDGTRIGANRCILGSRSDVLRSMLYGSFSEASSEEIPMKCPGKILIMIAEYCYTDHIDELDEIVARLVRQENTPESELEGDGSNDVRDCRAISSLAMSSDFLDLPNLGEITVEAVKKISTAVPRLACVFFDETIACRDDPRNCKDGLVSAGQKVFRHALSIIEANPVLSLWGYEAKTVSRKVVDLLESCDSQKSSARQACRNAGVLSLSPVSLKDIISNANLVTTEITMFCALKTWATITPNNLPRSESMFQEHAMDHPTEAAIFEDAYSEKSRFEIAKDLTRYIHLDKIKPHHLNEIVAPSGLISTEQLLEGYRLHSLLAERRGFSHPTSRATLWDDGSAFDKSSIHVMIGPQAAPATVYVPDSPRNKYRNVFLQCEDMVPGNVYNWKLRVNTGSPQYDEVWVGIVNTSVWASDRYGGFLACGDKYPVANSNSPGRGSFFGDKYFGYLYAPALGQTVNRGYRTCQRYPIHIGEDISISFTLDLREDARGGSLTAKVDSRPTRVLFDNLLSNNNAFAGKKPTFVPAAVLMNQGKIEFIGFSQEDEISQT